MKTSLLKRTRLKYFYFLMLFNKILIFSVLIFFFYDNKMKVSEGIMVYILSMSEALE